MFGCMHLAGLVEVNYYYDDDWGVRGSQVWPQFPSNDPRSKKKYKLCMCNQCGALVVVPDEDTITPD